MSFGKKSSLAATRVARIAATGAGGPAAAPKVSYADAEVLRKQTNPFGPDETPEARRMRLRAKTVNFGATFGARAVIMAAACFFLWQAFVKYGIIDHWLGFGVVAMGADFSRVLAKCMTPGTK